MSTDIFARYFAEDGEGSSLFKNLPRTIRDIFSELNKTPEENLHTAVSKLKEHYNDNELVTVKLGVSLLVGWNSKGLVNELARLASKELYNTDRMFGFWDRVFERMISQMETAGLEVSHREDNNIQDNIQTTYERQEVKEIGAEIDPQDPAYKGFLDYMQNVNTTSDLGTIGEIIRLANIYNAQVQDEEKLGLDLLVDAMVYVNQQESGYFDPVISWFTEKSIENLVIGKYFKEFPLQDLSGSSLRWVYNVLRRIKNSLGNTKNRQEKIKKILSDESGTGVNERVITLLTNKFDEIFDVISGVGMTAGIKELGDTFADMQLPPGFTLLEDLNRQSYFGDSPLLDSIKEKIIIREINALIKKGLPLTPEEKVFMTRAYYTKLLKGTRKRDERDNLMEVPSRKKSALGSEESKDAYINAFHDEETYQEVLLEVYGSTPGRRTFRSEG